MTLPNPKVRSSLALIAALALGEPATPLPAPGGSAVCPSARADWYLRESLVAIRDWEQILTRRAEGGEDEDATPLFPVPVNGEAVAWPNPIPRPLLPLDDRDLRVTLRLIAGQLRIDHARPGVEPETKQAPADKPVSVYHHPGGGGKSRWYHRYTRRFDHLCSVRPGSAPFVVQFDARPRLGLGSNTVEVGLRNVTDAPLRIEAGLTLHTARGGPEAADSPQSLDIPARAARSVRFPLTLSGPGGGLVVLDLKTAVEDEPTPFRVPLLTHVEDVPAVLGAIGTILADTPDRGGQAALEGLSRRATEALEPAARGHGGSSAEAWRALFEEASALRDELLLKRIDFDALLFLKRRPFDSEQPFMDAHHCYNSPGGGIYRLSPVRPDGHVTPVVDSLGLGVYRDLCLHWNAHKLLFAFGNGADRGRPTGTPAQNYCLFEVAVDGSGLRRLTSGPKNDCEPFYLPNGQIGFTSDRSEQYVMCGSNIHVANLFVMDSDGSGVRQLSFNVFNDFNPSMLPDGRILYSRWEYNERSVTSLHGPFTIRPDGRMMAPYYGNASIRPNVVMFPRAVPESSKIMALFTGHHGQTHGPIGLIDRRRGVDGPAPVTVLTPHVPTIGERIEDSRHGWYSDPMPLSESTYLCSYTPTVRPWLARSWALYVGDRHGNLALVYRDPEISCAEPRPVVASPRPHELEPADAVSDGLDAEAELVLVRGHMGLRGVDPATPRHLRIIEDVPRIRVPQGGVIVTAGTKTYTVKRIVGTVPLEADGSAYFTVPANRNVYFELLDKDGLEIQRMRSVVCLKPNERRSCIGCHEPQLAAPPNVRTVASRSPRRRPVPPPWGDAILSFLRDVQPVLNSRCVRCHTHDRVGKRLILTDDLTQQFCIAYEELLPYLRVANAMRWDHPEDVEARPPYTYGSEASAITKHLRAGHHEVQLNDEEWQRLATWVDANAVYYDRYEALHPKRHLFPVPAREAIADVHKRRCASCHGKGDGRFDTWWLSLNWRDVRLSRALAAPLARKAGGWGRCDGPVFANAEDADYQLLLSTLTSVREQLRKRPRADLLSVRGTPAERQTVKLPDPPVRGPADRHPTEGNWEFLSSIDWERASSGWTPNKDGLPRLDTNVSGGPLRAGARIHGRGIGTHAPSELVYDLDGQYTRFFALVCGAEENGTVVFQVLGDGKPLYDSGVLHGLRGPRRVDVPVAGVRRLQLVVTDAGDNYYCDMANWADARLLRASQQTE